MPVGERIDNILWHGEGAWQQTNAVDALLHELRAPLGATSYALDVMTRLRDEEGRTDTVESERMLRTAQLGVLEAQALVRWFYRMRTLTNGRLEPEVELTSVIDSIDRALILLPRLRVRVTAARDVPMVYADSLWLTQVLTNLIDNATKHTPDTAETQVFVRRYAPDRVVVSVTDNGSGIPLEQQREIFRPSVRVGPPDEGDGHGLGLSIAHFFVRAMGGRIWVQSNGRNGTTVRFTLTAADEECER